MCWILHFFLVEKHIGILSVLFIDRSPKLSDNFVIAFVPLVVQTFHYTCVMTFPALLSFMYHKAIQIKNLKVIHMYMIRWLTVYDIFVSFWT